jgi:hypothetical protein
LRLRLVLGLLFILLTNQGIEMDYKGTFENFITDLEVLADLNGIYLHLERYHYHTYYTRGYKPQLVIDDIKNIANDAV